jgi:PKD repeat protein
MAVDAAGNISVVSGPAGGRLLSVKSYTPSGTLRWQQTLAPAAGTFVGDWIAAAPNGDVVALGHSLDSRGGSFAPVLARFSANGTLLWRVDRANLLFGVARMLVDGAGDVYVVVNSDVTKYSAAGAQLWMRTLPAGLAQSATLGPDESDVVVVAAAGARWTTVSYQSASGALRWAVTAAEGPAAKDVVIDAARVYVTGQGAVGTAGFLSVIAYDRQTGARLWRTDASPSGSQAAGLRIALAPDGSVVATGYISSGGYLDWWTAAVNSSGLVLWQSRRDGALSGDETPSAVFVLPDGTTVVSGTGGPVIRDVLGNSFMQGVVAGYGPTGVLLWEGFARLGVKSALPLSTGDVCASGGYDALITCWRVAAAAQPPTAIASATPTSGTAPLTVSFDGSGSVANEGSIVSYAWSFGDGGTATGAVATHVYAAPSTYTATLTVTNSANLTASATARVVVSPSAGPTAPTNLAALVLSRSSVRLLWRNTTANQSEVRVERCAGAGCTNFAIVAVLPGTSTSVTDTGLASRTTYSYRVSARNAAGSSPYSNVATVRTR